MEELVPVSTMCRVAPAGPEARGSKLGEENSLVFCTSHIHCTVTDLFRHMVPHVVEEEEEGGEEKEEKEFFHMWLAHTGMTDCTMICTLT